MKKITYPKVYKITCTFTNGDEGFAYMRKRLYLVKGIPYVMAENSKEFRQDLKLFKENNEEVSARMSLTPFQALMVRLQIAKYNATHPVYMELVKMRAKRYRV